MELTNNQKDVLNSVLQDIRNSNGKNYLNTKLITVGGYAGTGKTTLIPKVRKAIFKDNKHDPVAFATLMGKASSVLNQKLIEQDALYGHDYCGTIHGLIYKPDKIIWNKKLKTYVVSGWRLRHTDELGYYKVIVIDEASMISKKLWEDLSLFNITVIAFGDHGQLPPISDDKNNFSLLKNPTYILTEIHRQAFNSPIIKLSKFVREEGYIPFGVYSESVFKMSWKENRCKQMLNKIDFTDNNLIGLCAFNNTRASINNNIRKKLNFTESAPYAGEKIVCLSNNHSNKIMNGQIGNVVWILPGKKSHMITIDINDNTYESFVSSRCFGEVQYTMYDKSFELKTLWKHAMAQGYTVDFFDYGYMISVHKSQGSEWNKVVLFEQRTSRWDDKYYTKWLYTAITRAKEKLFIISDYWE